ncbi:hypothetical protein N7533_000740 [Penicillium manginii]|uniref:uncharacterized protein n=1 Tax=Penicillium manginii TaxID=203109 RepID=UPI0025470801|nr:uncharacterized protein N7533_000740 [Penicillium manginii]KAJ5768157.1 hypothetical protein N7533_000740 [Penicillium manginii]
MTICQLSRMHNRKKRQRSLYGVKKKLLKVVVDQIREHSKKDSTISNIRTETLFHYGRRVMPNRRLFADILPRKDSLRETDDRQALRALESICLEDSPIAYREPLKPLGGKCHCGALIKEQWLHLYRCNKSHYRCHSKLEFTEMCFECDTWFTDPGEWEFHCSEHLQLPDTLLRCDPLMFRNAPIKAGLCPFCLGNKHLGLSKRMTQYATSRSEWYAHIQSHVIGLTRFECKHPACQLNLKSQELLIHHLMDAHCWTLGKASSKKRKHDSCT